MLRVISILILLSNISCLRTNDQIRKDQVVETLPSQVEQSQKLIAQMTLRMNELETRLQNYNGNIEEIEYRQQKLIPSTQQEIQNKMAEQSKEINSLRSEIMKNERELSNVKSLLAEQKEYISKVNETLANLSKPSSTTQTSTDPLKHFKDGIKYYQQKKHDSAETHLLLALKNEKLSAADTNVVYQALGHIEFTKKNYSQSNIYFSKIFTKYPNSSMAPDALLHMARAFREQKNQAAAKEAYNTFIKEYPSHSYLSSAKKELSEL